MADITEYLRIIKSAVLGKDMRNAIHDALEATNANGQTAIDNEATARKNGDLALGNRIDDEISARQTADSDLNKNITASYTALQNNLNSEASARQEADDKLKAALDAHTIGMDNKHNAESIDYDDPSGDGINVGVALDTLYGKVENKANQGWITQDGDVWKSIDGVTENGIYSIDYYSGHWTDIPLPNITNNNQSKQNYEPSGLFVFRKAVSGNAEQVFQVIFGIEDEGHGCLIYRKKDNAEAGSWSQWQYADNDVRAVLLEKADFKNSSNGFNAGDQSASTDGGAAAGRLAKTASGGALGSQTESESGFAGGYHAKATGGGAIGHSAETSNGGAVGHNSYAQYGGAVGRGAKGGDGLSAGKDAAVKNIGTSDAPKYIDAIQLGTGTNNNPKTLQVYDYQVTEQGSDGTLHLKDVGNLKDLKTYDKSNIVAAVNESRAIVNGVVITDGNELNDLTVTRVYTGTFNITTGEPIPGIGRRDSTDFVLKSYGFTNYDLEDYVYQELYFVDDGRSYKVEHYERFYDYLTETWSDWKKAASSNGSQIDTKGSYNDPYIVDAANDCVEKEGWYRVAEFFVDDYSGNREFRYEIYYNIPMLCLITNKDADGEPREMSQYAFVDNVILSRSTQEYDGAEFVWNDSDEFMELIDIPTQETPAHLQSEKLTITSATEPSGANSKLEPLKVRDNRVDILKTTTNIGDNNQKATSAMYITNDNIEINTAEVDANKTHATFSGLTLESGNLKMSTLTKIHFESTSGGVHDEFAIYSNRMDFGNGGATLYWDKNAEDSEDPSNSYQLNLHLPSGSVNFEEDGKSVHIHTDTFTARVDRYQFCDKSDYCIAEIQSGADIFKLNYEQLDPAIQVTKSTTFSGIKLRAPTNGEHSKIEISDESVTLFGNVMLDSVETAGISDPTDIEYLKTKNLPSIIIELKKEIESLKAEITALKPGA